MSDTAKENTPSGRLDSSASSSLRSSLDTSLDSQGHPSLLDRHNFLSPPNDFKADVKKAKRKESDLESDNLSFGAEDEDASAYPFSESPVKSRGALPPQNDSDADEGIRSLHRFMLYETSTRFYLVGQDILETHFRILKIDRTSPPGHLNIFEDENVYDRQSISELLTTIEDGNKGSGGLKIKCSAWGILGFIRFTEAYYMLLITKRTQAAMVGGHYVYQVEATELVPLTTGSSSRFQRDRNPEEARYLGILANIDLNKSFYFSYSYNITQTLQHNITQQKLALNQGSKRGAGDWNDMFVWNHYLLQPAKEALKNMADWCVPVIHGYIEQASLDVFGRRVYITIVARRSRFFAGARYLKRGSNDHGFVANDVETEQIVSDLVTTSFHAPGPTLYSNPSYTSYVQHRGSIPLHWSQENTGVTPKPDINISLSDPFYSSAALHFDNLFMRYGAPVYVLNLIKARERTPRESKLLEEYEKALIFLNQSLPAGKKILYRAYDMSREAKTRGRDVIGTLELIAEDIMQKTSFFQNGDYSHSEPRMQNGVARTNCIDCLDRTNAAQFVIGKRALGRQLKALGVISGNTVEYDTDAVNTLTHMFHAHGDTIAIQYGGSHLAHTMATYRKINEWKSHSRDVVESFKRYYHNSFLDSQRQEAYNLFLGNFVYTQGQPMLWDLFSDHYLHHENPRLWATRTIRHYINWYTPEFLEPRILPRPQDPLPHAELPSVTYVDDYWLEYYRPLAISSFVKIFSWKISSRPRYLHDGTPQEVSWDPSPFVPRKLPQEPDSPGKKTRKGVTILDPHNNDARSISSAITDRLALNQGDYRSRSERSSANTFVPGDKTQTNQWTMKQWHDNLLNPSITTAEEEEYLDYVNHPLKLPLVISSEVPDLDKNPDFAAYLARASIDVAHDGSEDGDMGISEENFADYSEFVTVADNPNPLTVTEEDGGRKRYKAYRQWLKGKSFFKQSKVDPEYRAQN